MSVEGPNLSSRTSGRPCPKLRLALEAIFLLLLISGVFALSLYREIHALAGQPRTFSCTLYYTPIEAAFVGGKGFNLLPETRPGLGGISYPADFLKAVAMEGFGRLKKPEGEKKYIFFNGHWGYANAPAGNRSNPLEARLSCAISSRNGNFSPGDWILLRSKNLPLKIEARPWRVDDVGPGVGLSQIDLYWGEDGPAGPGDELQRPAGIELSRVAKVGVYPIPEKSRLLRFWLALQESPFSGLTLRFLNPLMDSALETADTSIDASIQKLAKTE